MGRPRKFEEAAVLERATEVFWSKGYRATSLDDLTEATGLNRPSLYGAFGDKEALFCRCLENYGDRYFGPILQEASGALNGREALERLIGGMAHLLERPELPGGCLVVLTVAESRGLSPQLAEISRKSWEGMIELLESLVQRAVTDGSLREVDRKETALWIATTLYGTALAARVSGEPASTLLAPLLQWLRATP